MNEKLSCGCAFEDVVQVIDPKIFRIMVKDALTKALQQFVGRKLSKRTKPKMKAITKRTILNCAESLHKC